MPWIYLTFDMIKRQHPEFVKEVLSSEKFKNIPLDKIKWEYTWAIECPSGNIFGGLGAKYKNYYHGKSIKGEEFVEYPCVKQYMKKFEVGDFVCYKRSQRGKYQYGTITSFLKKDEDDWGEWTIKNILDNKEDKLHELFGDGPWKITDYTAKTKGFTQLKEKLTKIFCFV